MTPPIIGRYRIVRRLGSGGFATGWLAEDPWLDTRVAIKVLADIHSNDPDLRARFLQEARLLRRIRTPHVVTVYDVGETDSGQPFFVMEEASEERWRHGSKPCVLVGGGHRSVMSARSSTRSPADSDPCTPPASATTWRACSRVG